MRDITKIVKYLEVSCLLIIGISETIENQTKEQEKGFLAILLGTLDASILENLLEGKNIIKASDVTNRNWQDF